MDLDARATACRASSWTRPRSSPGSTGASGFRTCTCTSSGHADEYDAIVFSPYLFWSTLYCAGIAPERTILMPCLHDEPYAYLRSVAAALGILGRGLVPLRARAPAWPQARAGGRPPLGGRRGGRRSRRPTTRAAFASGTTSRRPYVLYAGRREGGKGWQELVAGYGIAALRHRLPFDLVTVGVGRAEVPPWLENRIVDLGYLAPAEVPDAFAAAEAFLQPSANESFSRTIMEAWLAETVVIANGESDVVTWHCERSGGGLVYADELELGQCLRFVAEAPEAGGRARPQRAASTCSPTTPGRRCSTPWSVRSRHSCDAELPTRRRQVEERP